jgi:ribosome maturation factor RimP
MEVRITSDDVGGRVVIRHRRADDQVTDVLGTLEAADDDSFTVRTSSGETVSVPRDRALAAKTIPPSPARRRDR